MAALSVHGNLYPALKGLALGTFTIHFAALAYVLQSNMHHPTLLSPRSYSPNVYFLTAFCVLSASLNLMWLKGLMGEEPDNDCNATASATMKNEEYFLQNVHKPRRNDEELALSDVQERQQLVNVKSACLPFYIVGNILLSLSSFSARQELHELSHFFVISNTLVQILLLYTLSDDVRNSVITPANLLTHLVMKTNIGLDAFLLWRTWSILNKMETPSIDQLMTISAAFVLAAISSGPDPILGLSILFVLFSLIFSDDVPCEVDVGSVVTWQFTFRLLAIVITACLAIEFILSKRRNFPWLSGWKPSSNRIIAT